MAAKPTKKKVKAAKAKAAPKSKIKKAVKKTVKAAAKKSAAKPKPVKAVAKPIKKKKVVAAKPVAKKAVKKPAKVSKQPLKKAAKTQSAKPVKPIAKPVVKPIAKTTEKPVVKVVEKPVAKPIVNAEKTVKIEKPEVKKEIKPVVKKQPVEKVNGAVDNRTRYSDEELKEFKELITLKLETARGELKYLQEQISRSSEMGDDSDARFKGLEDGTSTSEREYLSQMASRQIQYIGHLEKAMIRIENKTYGICRETGRLISKERLRAVPHATLSIEAKQGGKG